MGYYRARHGQKGDMGTELGQSAIWGRTCISTYASDICESSPALPHAVPFGKYIQMVESIFAIVSVC